MFSADAWYTAEVKRFTNILGAGITAGAVLDRIGGQEFPGKWAGIFMADQDYPIGGYCVVNTDHSGEPGTHWVAVGEGMLYDSFGRRDILKNTRLSDTEYDAEQRQEEENCGQRCLAWLSVLETYGPTAAADI